MVSRGQWLVGGWPGGQWLVEGGNLVSGGWTVVYKWCR